MLAAGQRWRFQSLDSDVTLRLVIGAILGFEAAERVICVSMVAGDGTAPIPYARTRTIAFLPLCETAFRATVTEIDGMGEPAEGFAAEFEIWRSDPRGLTVFTVPFDGSVDRLIARQMEAIVRERPTSAD